MRRGRARPSRGERMKTQAMGDVFMERMVKKKFESTDALVLLGIIVAMVVVVFIGFIVGFVLMPMPMITFLVVIGAGFGGYKLLTMRLLEYEYSLTNGYVAVDKIMNRASRKRMTAFECSSAEDIGEYQKNEARLKNQSFDDCAQPENRQNSGGVRPGRGDAGGHQAVYPQDLEVGEVRPRLICKATKEGLSPRRRPLFSQLF